MSLSPDPIRLADEFADLLIGWHDAIRTNSVIVPPDSSTISDPAMRVELDRFRTSLELLEKVRRRRQKAAPCTSPSLSLPGAPERKVTHLGRFLLQEPLGSGGHGVVFRAYDPQLQRDVALKVPHPDKLLTGDLLERFRREAQIAASLDHPHLVPLYEARTVDTLTFLVYAYVPGPNLADWLRQRPGPLPWRMAVKLVADLTKAVVYLHQHKSCILHRDIKPSNVLLQPLPNSTTDFIPRLTDFGLAWPGDEAARLTRTGTVLGTAAYMAPEQAAGDSKRIGPAADIYALGCVLYELLTRRTPYQGQNDFEILQRLATEEVVPLRRHVPDLPLDVETVCLRCLERAPHQRYATAAELEEDLQRLLKGLIPRARRTTWPERLWRQARRHPRTTVLGGVLLLATALGILAELRSIRHTEAARERDRVQYPRQIAAIQRLLQQGDDATALAELNALRPAAGAPDLRQLEWYLLRERCRQQGLVLRLAPGTQVRATAWSPNGRYVLTGDSKGTVALWQASTGELVWKQHAPTEITAVAFGPDSQRVFSGTVGGRLHVRAAADGQLLVEVPSDPIRGAVTGVAPAPDGCGVYFVGGDGFIRYLDLRTGVLQQHQPPEKYPLVDVACSPDGQTILAVEGHLLYRYRPGTLRDPVSAWLSPESHRLAWRAHGSLVAVGGRDGLMLVDSQTLVPQSHLPLGGLDVQAFGFQPGTNHLTVAWQPQEQLPGRIEILESPSLLRPEPRVFREEAGRQTTFGCVVVPPPKQQLRIQALAVHQPGGQIFLGGKLGSRSCLGVVGMNGGIWKLSRYSQLDSAELHDLAVDRNGQLGMAGSFRWSPPPGKEPPVAPLKLPPWRIAILKPAGTDGDLAWTLQGRDHESSDARGIALDETGAFYVTGFCGPRCVFPGTTSVPPTDGPALRAWLWKLRPDKTTEWLRFLPHESAGLSVHLLPGPGQPVVVAGWSWRERRRKPFLWKLDRAGQTLEQLHSGSSQGQAEFTKVTSDTTGNLLLAGSFTETLDLGPMGLGTVLRVAPRTCGSFILKQGPDGTCQWVHPLPSTDGACRIAPGPHDSIYIAGTFRGEGFLPGAVKLRNPDNLCHAYCALLDASGKTVWAFAFEGSGESRVDAMIVDDVGQVRLAGTCVGPLEGELAQGRFVEGQLRDPQRTFLAQLRPVLRAQPPLQFSRSVQSVAWSPDGKTLLCGGNDALAVLKSFGDRPVELSTAPEEAWDVAFSPDGRTIAIGCDTENARNGLRLHEVASGRVLWQAAEHERLVTAVTFTPDGSTVISAGFDGSVRLHDAATGRQLASLQGHTAAVRCLALTPDGRVLATAGKDKVIRLWDPVTRQARGMLPDHEQQVMALAFSPDGQTLASSSSDNTVRLWDYKSGRCLQVFSEPVAAWGLAFSPDGRWLAIGRHQGWLRLIDRKTGAAQSWVAHTDEIRALLFTADSKRLISGGKDGHIKIHDVATGQELLSLHGHKREVQRLALRRDGSLLASAGLDGRVCLWWATPPE